MWLRATATGLLLAAAASPVATTNEIYVLAAQTGQANYVYQTVRIDDPLTLTTDPSGVLHLGVQSNALLTAGSGIIFAIAPSTSPTTPLAVSPPNNVTISVDTTNLAFRTITPTAPGVCSQPTAWATDAAFFYMCVPDSSSPPDGGFIWARTPLVTSW